MDELKRAVLSVDDPSSPAISVHALEPLTANEVGKMASRLNPEAILELGLIPMEDHPSFEYRTKESEYIAFNLASAGQQATALLRILLNQGGLPLIIDQTDDDLDSQVILSIGDQIWNAKRARQLIFSSHNANLVVNGDAELVVRCDYGAAGSVGRANQGSGRYRHPHVRAEITVVMEAGEKAFRLRKETYGF